jgi:hypothetical protein
MIHLCMYITITLYISLSGESADSFMMHHYNGLESIGRNATLTTFTMFKR